MLSSTANALLAWRTANFVNIEFWLLFDGFCRVVAETHPRPIFTTAQTSPRPAIARASPRFAERRRCLVWLGAALARDRTSRGTRRRRDPYKRVARSRNSTRRAYRASTPLATKGQLQRPVLVSTSAREAVPRASFQAREGLAVLVAEGRLDCGRRGVEQLHSYSAAPTTAKQAKNKPWSWPSAPRH